jgi:hypothetical protein
MVAVVKETKNSTAGSPRENARIPSVCTLGLLIREVYKIVPVQISLTELDVY